MSDREEIIELIRNEYDPKPDLKHWDYPAFDWDDGAGRIADAILADKVLALRKAADRIKRLEAALRRIDAFEVHKKDVAAKMMQAIAHAALDQDAGIGCDKSVIEPWNTP